MPVKPDSRYAELPMLDTAAPDGGERRVLALRLERPAEPVEAVPYRLRHGETVELLARRFFGDERLWWRLLDANPLIHPFDLEPGDVINVPRPSAATRTTRARRF